MILLILVNNIQALEHRFPYLKECIGLCHMGLFSDKNNTFQEIETKKTEKLGH